MNKFLFLTLFFLISISAACKPAPSEIPLGTWKYDILVNGIKNGTAVITNSLDNGRYTSNSRMEIKAGKISNTTEQVLVETTEFKPVRLEIKNRIIHGDVIEKIDTVAEFNDQQVTLDSDGNKRTFTINQPFVLDGNLYMRELIKAGFKQGTTLTLSVYEPTIEVEEPIPVKIAVVGREKVDVKNEMKELIHIVQFIAGIKSVDIYMDDSGITYKAVIVMLNNKLELILQ